MNAMAGHALRVAQREEKKSSMISRLSEEQSDLFTLLSAQDWSDHHPRLSAFASQLLSDKDPWKAHSLITSETRSWRGMVCKRGITQFFCMGYAAVDVNVRPGGFTIFMFRPKSVGNTQSQSTMKQAVRAIFGDQKVDDDTVSYFAQNELYLADSIDNLETQLDTCVRFLDLITAERGIASEGYARGLRLLRKDRMAFETLQTKDHLFAVKVAYLLDRIFQTFVNTLSESRSEAIPIQAAKRHLKYLQEEEVNGALTQIRYGMAPNIQLPASITEGNDPSDEPTNEARTPNQNEGRATNQAAKKRKKETADSKTKETDLNHAREPAWTLPQGQRYGEFFNPARTPENTKNWPVLQHHSEARKAAMCMRFQCDGKCTKGCPFAHVNPDVIPSEIRETITARLKKIYKS
jgi:hypothetical protein